MTITRQTTANGFIHVNIIRVDRYIMLFTARSEITRPKDVAKVIAKKSSLPKSEPNTYIPRSADAMIKAYFTTLGKDLAEAQAQKDVLAAALQPLFS